MFPIGLFRRLNNYCLLICIQWFAFGECVNPFLNGCQFGQVLRCVDGSAGLRLWV